MRVGGLLSGGFAPAFSSPVGYSEQIGTLRLVEGLLDLAMLLDQPDGLSVSSEQNLHSSS